MENKILYVEIRIAIPVWGKVPINKLTKMALDMIEMRGFLCQLIRWQLVHDDQVIDECMPVTKQMWDYINKRVNKNAKEKKPE